MSEINTEYNLCSSCILCTKYITLPAFFNRNTDVYYVWGVICLVRKRIN